MANSVFEVVSVQRGSVTVVLNESMVNDVLDVLEGTLRAGETLPPAVYAMGERMTKAIAPNTFFGVRPKKVG